MKGGGLVYKSSESDYILGKKQAPLQIEWSVPKWKHKLLFFLFSSHFIAALQNSPPRPHFILITNMEKCASVAIKSSQT